MSRLLACFQAPRVEQSPTDSLLIAQSGHSKPVQHYCSRSFRTNQGAFIVLNPVKRMSFVSSSAFTFLTNTDRLFWMSLLGCLGRQRFSWEAHFWRTVMKGFKLILCLSWTPKYIHWDSSRSSNFKRQEAVTDRSVDGCNSDLTVL